METAQPNQDRLFLTSMQCRQLVGVFGDMDSRMAVGVPRKREERWLPGIISDATPGHHWNVTVPTFSP